MQCQIWYKIWQILDMVRYAHTGTGKLSEDYPDKIFRQKLPDFC